MTRRTIEELRSQRWYASEDMRGFAHRQRTQQMGLRREEFLGKPVVGIINTWSELSPCHSHLRDRAEAVKRGVWQAGGYPVELPALSVGEVMVKPTTMLYRNFLAMEVEELLRSHPIDGAVLLGGCDKSTPGLLMGAISMDLPVVFCPAGPMSNGQKLLKQGVRDMVRICDGRMSGTHYGTCILHVSPEAAVGGPLALLKTGDLVELDVEAGRLDMRVDEAELARRRAEWRPTAPLYERSFAALYQRHVSQADEGCDFDFLSGPGSVTEPSIF